MKTFCEEVKGKPWSTELKRDSEMFLINIYDWIMKAGGGRQKATAELIKLLDMAFSEGAESVRAIDIQRSLSE